MTQDQLPLQPWCRAHKFRNMNIRLNETILVNAQTKAEVAVNKAELFQIYVPEKNQTQL